MRYIEINQKEKKDMTVAFNDDPRVENKQKVHGFLERKTPYCWCFVSPISEFIYIAR
jgi:hypothetical protein